MASVAKRPDGRWRARYRDFAGREHSKHFARKRDAEVWLSQVTASIVTGHYVDPRAGRVTVRDYAAAWERAQVGREGTARITDNALRLHILPVIGDRPMASVRTSDVRALVKGWSEVLSPGSVGNVYATLTRMFAAAVDDRVIPLTPCLRIALPRKDDAEVAVPPVSEVVAMAEAVGPFYRAAVVTLAGSGLRIGELLGLRPDDVDWLRRTVRVERQRLQSGEVGPCKTPKSVRTVPVGQVVIDELAAHLAANGRGEWLFERPDGRPLDYRTWKRVWNVARTASGLTLDTHDLRHFCASALIAGGASVKQVQTVLGHSSATVTLKVYAHLWPGDDDRTRSVMDAALDVLRTGCGPSGVSVGETAGQSG